MEPTYELKHGDEVVGVASVSLNLLRSEFEVSAVFEDHGNLPEGITVRNGTMGECMRELGECYRVLEKMRESGMHEELSREEAVERFYALAEAEQEQEGSRD